MINDNNGVNDFILIEQRFRWDLMDSLIEYFKIYFVNLYQSNIMIIGMNFRPAALILYNEKIRLKINVSIDRIF